jgi:hypothetical protein
MRYGAHVLAATALIACGSGSRDMPAPPSRQSPKVLRAEHPVPDQYVVLLHASAVAPDDVEFHASDLARRHDAAILRTWRHAVRGFAARMTPAQALALAEDPRVAIVEEDAEVHLDVAQAGAVTQAGATWGLDRIDQRTLPLDLGYTYGVDGTGVSAYIIDTGIRTTHAEFGRRAFGAFSAVNDGNGTNDCNGHGTHVAGTVGGSTFGVAKNVHLFAVRVLDCAGSGTVSGVVSGVDWVTSHHASPAVANMSIGGAASVALDTAVQGSIASGVTYAVAAGNSSADACAQSPASVATAITVGASDASDARAVFSNFGPCVDLFAPGVNITSAWATSDAASNTLSGTSMATPHVTGTAALYLSANPTATPAQVASALVANATPGVLGSVGLGSPNALLYEAFITAGVRDTTPPAVLVTAPATSAIVGGTVTLSATAIDDVGVSRVDFFVDGALVGTGAAAPYSSAWDSALAANGAHAITAVATDPSGNASASASVPVTVSNVAPTCSTTTQLLGNPGFETGTAAPWTATSFVINGSVDPPAHTGAFKAWLDGYGSFHTDTLFQTVTIPAQACAADLSFWLLIRTAETTTTVASDRLTVTVTPVVGPPTTLATYSNLDSSPTYVEHSFDLTSFRGQTITIGFRGVEDIALATSFVLDDVTLEVIAGGLPDTTPPRVLVTAPAAGATVSGAVTLSANAFDDVEVAKVDFFVDGALVGTAATAPYSSGWYSTLVANGPHAITAVATDLSGNASTSASVPVTVSNVQPPCSTTAELLGNPGFETGTAAPWTATSAVVDRSVDPPAHTGVFKAWLDGYASPHTDTLSRTVTIPARACGATFSFWLLVRTAETTTTVAFDTLTVTVTPAVGPPTTLATYSNLDGSPIYVQHVFDVTAFTGQTVTIGFRGVEDNGGATSFVVDDASLQVTL